MSDAAAQVAVAHPLTAEDRGRSEFYALLARLYADGPDQPLLRAIAGADRIESDAPLATTWNRLIEASGVMDADAAAQEYTDLFIGVGRAEVNLHASHWVAGAMNEKPLAELRTVLAGLGLARRADVSMLEDHLSAVLETMRVLIAGQPGRAPSPIGTQKLFFHRHIGRWAFSCCDAIRESPIANYYVRVAEFTGKYLALDRDALAME